MPRILNTSTFVGFALGVAAGIIIADWVKHNVLKSV